MPAEPKSISEAMKDAAGYLKIADKIERGELLSIFDEIVGPNIAKFAKVKSITNKILFIEVESSSWRSELFILREEIKNKINKHFNKEVIKEIRLL
ncbi:MAG: DUF721 domain-containing protein [Ignavibacteria bacterium]|nr:DUF721 domain-containing protein [Ignavibacteria bacterium]